MLSIQFDVKSKTYQILKTIPTRYKDKDVSTDLMTSYGGKWLAVSNFFHHSSSLYKFNEGDVEYMKDIPYEMGDKVHGVKFFSKDVLAMTSRRSHGGISFVDIKSGKEIYKISMKGYSVQDVCILSKRRFLTVSTLGSPKNEAFRIYDSILHELQFDGKNFSVIKKILMKASHLDSIVQYQDRLYTTDQYNDKVLVLNPESLEVVDELLGYDFPHGIDVNHGLVAVTNYGSNSIDIRPLP